MCMMYKSGKIIHHGSKDQLRKYIRLIQKMGMRVKLRRIILVTMSGVAYLSKPNFEKLVHTLDATYEPELFHGCILKHNGMLLQFCSKFRIRWLRVMTASISSLYKYSLHLSQFLAGSRHLMTGSAISVSGTSYPTVSARGSVGMANGFTFRYSVLCRSVDMPIDGRHGKHKCTPFTCLEIDECIINFVIHFVSLMKTNVGLVLEIDDVDFFLIGQF